MASSSGAGTGSSLNVSGHSDQGEDRIYGAITRATPVQRPIALRPPLMDSPSISSPQLLDSPVRRPGRAAVHGPVPSMPHGINRVNYVQPQSRGNSPSSNRSSQQTQPPHGWQQQMQASLADVNPRKFSLACGIGCSWLSGRQQPILESGCDYADAG
jgi:hypothetical protein